MGSCEIGSRHVEEGKDIACGAVLVRSSEKKLNDETDYNDAVPTATLGAIMFQVSTNG
jgi:hypothetical protein